MQHNSQLNLFNFLCEGSVIEFPEIFGQLKQRAICISVKYDNQSSNIEWLLIMETGCMDIFTRDEFENFKNVTHVGVCESAKKTRYENIEKLQKDFKSGIFDFYPEKS